MSTPGLTWVKICANTSLADARVAAEAGADALGFVFAPSPRRVTIEQVAPITAGLPAGVEKIGVFIDSTLEEICAAVRACGLSGVQLHCEAAPAFTEQIRRALGPDLRILRVVHFGFHAAEQAKAVAADQNVDAILVDSRTATSPGGTGISFDWGEARATLFESTEGCKRLIAAGGLTPDNVGEAIATLRPWGVDVASGVESTPGRKDPEKVRRFVANVRSSAWR